MVGSRPVSVSFTSGLNSKPVKGNGVVIINKLDYLIQN